MSASHIRIHLTEYSPYVGRYCPIRRVKFQSGDKVVVCRKKDIPISFDVWREFSLDREDKCIFCNLPIEVELPLVNEISSVSPPLSPPPPLRPLLAPPIRPTLSTTIPYRPTSTSSKTFLRGSILSGCLVALISFGYWIFIDPTSSIARWIQLAQALFVGQMMLLTLVICLIPAFSYYLMNQRDRVGRVITETLLFLGVFLVFRWWLFGSNVFGIWLVYAAALIIILEAGSHLVEWYKIVTLERLARNAPFKSLQDKAEAVEKMFYYQLILYISVPFGLILGTIIGLVRGQSPQAIVILCLHLVLSFAVIILLYFLFYAFRRMTDTLFRASHLVSPQITTEQINTSSGFVDRLGQIFRFLIPSKQPETENRALQDLSLACMVSDLRKIYFYDATHNVALLIALVAVVISLWGFSVDMKWLVGSLIGLVLVFNQLPYVIGQAQMHAKVLEKYEGVNRAEVAEKLKKYAPLFPSFDSVAALFMSGTAGGIVYFLIDQFVKSLLQ